MATKKLTWKTVPRNAMTAAHVRACLSYDPETGVLTWKHRTDIPERVNAQFSGKVAGHRKNDCVEVRLNHVSYKAHKLAWVIMTGEWPQNMVDHIDGNTNNNIWSNLRSADMSRNKMNQGAHRDNKSGIKGINERRPGKWRAQICVNKKRIHIGTFNTKEEAKSAWLAEAQKLHGEFLRP